MSDHDGFRWCWPHFDVVTPADTRPRFLLNRYPHSVIGAMVIAFGRGWGVRWKDTPRHTSTPDEVDEAQS